MQFPNWPGVVRALGNLNKTSLILIKSFFFLSRCSRIQKVMITDGSAKALDETEDMVGQYYGPLVDSVNTTAPYQWNLRIQMAFRCLSIIQVNTENHFFKVLP